MATASKNPKVLLFDIGGVVSPFQSILTYELSLGIPPGWINHSISSTAPNGFWHRLETGSIPMDAAFFDGFSRDLHDPIRWEAFYRRQSLNQQAEVRILGGNLGDNDLVSSVIVPPVPDVDAEWLFNHMMRTATEPDPWMFPALKRLRDSGRYILAACSNTVIFPRGHPLATDDHLEHPITSLFDVFVSSAHVGLRKPDPKMYHLALKRVNEFARINSQTKRGKLLGWQEGVQPYEVVFLDDIGENLKAAKSEGFRTMKVRLGRTYEAVEELEHITGLKLSGGHPRLLFNPGYANANINRKAKI